MKPVLAKLPPRRRTLLFVPALLGIFLVLGLTLALTTHDPYVVMLVAIPGSVAATWALLGWPEAPRRKDGRPLVDPQHARLKPYLFFPLAPALVALLYILLGTPLTRMGVPVTLLAWVTLALALPLGCAAAYFLVGFPSSLFRFREAYERIPPERRPYLFYPIFVALFLVFYLGIGVATTEALDKVEGDRTTLLNLQLLLVLPLCVVLSGLLAYLLVGIPKPSRSPRAYLPKVTGKHRPRYFVLTLLLAGIPFTLIIGTLFNQVARSSSNRDAFLPTELVLPLAFILGYALSLGVAALAWGTPRRWRQYEDYEPGLPPRARLPVHLATGLAVMLAVTVVFGLLGLEIFYGLLVGFVLGALVTLQLAGMLPRILARRKAGTLLPDVPDRLKPLILFPTWFLLALVLFAALTFALPDLVAWNAVGSLVVGLAVALFLVEQSLLATWLDERRRARERRKAWKARRKEVLAQESEDPKNA
jgi:hypothetical protein